MKVLIAGAEGQIGRALAGTAPPDARVEALALSRLDITRRADVSRTVADFGPDLVINAAGYTAVDLAESEPEAARAANHDGPRHLAEAAAAAGARMLHYSTDYVFDGEQGRPYAPGDQPNPLGVYGATKLAGEREVLETLGDRAVVVRTAWVYAAAGRNFLRTMLRLLSEREQVTVVSDQSGTPTAASSVARASWAIAARPEVRGIVHWTDDGVATWYDFATAIREEALHLGVLARAAAVRPISTAEYPTPARRPRYSVLDCSATRAALQMVPEHWRVALRHTLGELADG
jgi:dTDP-4-dehydrorhamnose reductase